MARMLIAYIDESGNTGDPGNGGSMTFTLGCVLVDADAWPETFDGLLQFRRRIRDKFGVHMRAEVKANYLLRNGGALRRYRLGHRARHTIYRAAHASARGSRRPRVRDRGGQAGELHDAHSMFRSRMGRLAAAPREDQQI
ncbi:hypothetical protein MDOR_38520 [Mycolicibacterium doricum]|uniref:DUF3800 domain-containing protein n=1 Tax=Mycolicibacterium doricum TaxID=126673 RepID=A0A7I7VZZ0_9MYCO|nr:hypothetical protein MDOR_38520 [Mycolicibacterium doricum]